MCIVCFVSGREQIHDYDTLTVTGGSARAALFEIADAPANIATPYSMALGDTFSGQIVFGGDDDWIAITLTAGDRIRIALDGVSLSDPVVRLYDGSGSEVSFDDDGGPGLNSLLIYDADVTGTYYIGAEAFGTDVGTYTLSAALDVPPPPISNGTLNELAAYLTAEGQQLALWVFDMWEMVADIDFVEISGVAQIEFDDTDSGAYANYLASGITTLSSDVQISTDWLNAYGTTFGSYSFQTYVHEIGHSLGLGHQSNYNGSAGYPGDANFLNDSWQLSVMSYFDQSDNTNVNASYAYLSTTMAADVVAIQTLYGAAGAGSATAGNTVYGENTTLTNALGVQFRALLDTPDTTVYSGDPVAFTIHDRDGIDTIDFSDDTTNQRFTLAGGGISNIMGGIGNLVIARDTVIENFVAGTGNDDITGNAAANTLHGGGGNHVVRGGDGDDQLSGGVGNDILLGGAGLDTADYLDAVARVRVDLRITTGQNIQGGEGVDRLTDVENIIGSAGNDQLIGNTGDNVLYGLAGNDLMFGLAGIDRLIGGDGADRMYGGGSADVFIYRSISESNATTGQDTIMNFGFGADLINLSQIDANSLVAGNQAFSFIGSGPFTAAGRLQFVTNGVNGFVRGDVDGDGIQDFNIALFGITSVTVGDFIL